MVERSYGRITWTDKSTGKEKAKFDEHTLSWELSQELQWDILHPRPIIWFFKNKNWLKETRKAYGSRQNIVVVNGNKVKFYSPVYYQIFNENKHVDLPFLVNLG